MLIPFLASITIGAIAAALPSSTVQHDPDHPGPMKSTT